MGSAGGQGGIGWDCVVGSSVMMKIRKSMSVKDSQPRKLHVFFLTHLTVDSSFVRPPPSPHSLPPCRHFTFCPFLPFFSKGNYRIFFKIHFFFFTIRIHLNQLFQKKKKKKVYFIRNQSELIILGNIIQESSLVYIRYHVILLFKFQQLWT